MAKKKIPKPIVEPVNKRQTLETFFRYYELSSLLFDRQRDEIYDVTDIPQNDKFYEVAKDKATQLQIDWANMSHEDSNRIMLALLEDSFNLIREIENSKSITLQTKIIIHQ